MPTGQYRVVALLCGAKSTSENFYLHLKKIISQCKCKQVYSKCAWDQAIFVPEVPVVLPKVRRYKQAHLNPHRSRDLLWPTTPVLQEGASQNNPQFAEPSVDQASYTQGRQRHGAAAVLLLPPRKTQQRLSLARVPPAGPRPKRWPSKHIARSRTSSLTHLASATERCQGAQCKKTGWI